MYIPRLSHLQRSTFHIDIALKQRQILRGKVMINNVSHLVRIVTISKIITISTTNLVKFRFITSVPLNFVVNIVLIQYFVYYEI